MMSFSRTGSLLLVFNSLGIVDFGDDEWSDKHGHVHPVT